jgi:hypothetical protein
MQQCIAAMLHHRNTILALAQSISYSPFAWHTSCTLHVGQVVLLELLRWPPAACVMHHAMCSPAPLRRQQLLNVSMAGAGCAHHVDLW